MKNNQSIAERTKQLKRQLDSRPSNCRYCKRKLDNGKVEFVCEKTEKRTIFGVKIEKCYGDCKHYEKNFPEIYRDMIFSLIQANIDKIVSEPPKGLAEYDKNIWSLGYIQCYRDVSEELKKTYGRR